LPCRRIEDSENLNGYTNPHKQGHITSKVNSPSHEDRGSDFEEVLVRLSSFPSDQKELVIEYLKKMLAGDAPATEQKSRNTASIISSLEQLVIRYPNVDFTGFISRDNDKEHYQLWKLIDAFEETAKRLGRGTFDKLRITLIVFGKKITYTSDGTIAINYERFSKENLVKQLILMAQQQG